MFVGSHACSFWTYNIIRQNLSDKKHAHVTELPRASFESGLTHILPNAEKYFFAYQLYQKNALSLNSSFPGSVHFSKTILVLLVEKSTFRLLATSKSAIGIQKVKTQRKPLIRGFISAPLDFSAVC